MQVAPEYYPSAGPSVRYADVAGPIPANPSKMIVPPRNPAFGAYDDFLIQQAHDGEN